MSAAKHTPGPTRRALFLRRQMDEFRAQAAENRAHGYPAACWDTSASDCLHALGGMAGDWLRAIDERAAIAKATGAAS
jgi:hypothetical protein